MSERPLVHVIDDDLGKRESLAFLHSTADLDARTYPSAEAFLEARVDFSNGCVVTDVRMPGMSGLDLVRRLGACEVKPPVIVITGHGDVPMAVEAMKCGAFDFIEKPFDDDTLVAAVKSALASADARDEAATKRREAEAMFAVLSPRERDVLKGIVAGKLNKIIAYELGISPRTVEVYRANVMTKTGAANASDLVRMALKAGY